MPTPTFTDSRPFKIPPYVSTHTRGSLVEGIGFTPHGYVCLTGLPTLFVLSMIRNGRYYRRQWKHPDGARPSRAAVARRVQQFARDVVQGRRR